ncbi:uroporphyrinogen-III synthase [Scopulibacillus cellulosilyticus]|uniref:Uroporphyrinogen-III synthase n=1 Tax=Scopulibacillus cellulosilyticus TaxID=2665665 RepID=A0ABW2PW49_9BACL
MKGLKGKTIALASFRKSKEISQLIEKHGGHAKIRSTQGTRFLKEEEILKDIKEFIEYQPEWIIFTTSMGANALFDIAEKYHFTKPFINILKQAKLAARGKKTIQFLNNLDLSPEVTDQDGSVKGLVENLDSAALKGKRVFLQLYGESAPELVNWLKGQDAELMQSMPYEHVPPKQQIVDTLAEEITLGKVDAVVFTSSIQVKQFFNQIEKDHSTYQKVIEALNHSVAAAAVGQVTCNTLKSFGVKRVIVPGNPRMGAMIVKLSEYFSAKN